jgi:hypothetical protein
MTDKSISSQPAKHPEKRPLSPSENESAYAAGEPSFAERVLAFQHLSGNAGTQRLIQRGALAVPVRSRTPTLRVQRDAGKWQTWANTPTSGLEAAGHTVTANDPFLTVNNTIDVSESFLEYLLANDEAELKAIVNLSKKIEAGTVPIATIKLKMSQAQPGDDDAAKIVKLMRTKGGRLRFRVAIGTDNTSVVQEFLNTRVKPLNSNALPVYLQNPAPNLSFRLYDLANPMRNPKPSDDAIRWALSRGPTSVFEFVNFTEYFLASGEERKQIKENLVSAAVDKERRENKFTLQPDDPQVIARAKDLALKAVKKKIMDLVNGEQLMAKAGKQTTWEPLFTAGDALDKIYAVDLPGGKSISVTLHLQKTYGMPVTPKTAIMGAVDGISQVESQKEPIYSIYLNEAIDAIAAGKESARRDELFNLKQAEADTGLWMQFQAERGEVAMNRYSGAEVTIPGFWALPSDQARVDALKLAATGSPIPFTSSDSAVYHEKKHIEDLIGTAEQPPSRAHALGAYLTSARETVRNPARWELSHAQLTPKPGFFLFRTIPKREPDGHTQLMRAIVIVSPDGKVNIATYFNA